MNKTTRRFKRFPNILIDPKVVWGNPTLGRTRIPIFKIWEMVEDHAMEQLLESEPALTLGEINSVVGFVDWCMEFGLMERLPSGRLCYDKDALYKAALVDEPPKGKLCLYCHGFIPCGSQAAIQIKDRQTGSEDVREGITHEACIQAIVLDEPAPRANVLT